MSGTQEEIRANTTPKKQTNTFETMDMLLLPLLSRIFSVLQNTVNGTDEAVIHRRLQEAYLNFFTSLMNANLEAVFISPRNKSEFENVLSSLLTLALDSSDPISQRLSFGFFSKSIIAWGTSPEAATSPSVFAESAVSELSKKVEKGQARPTGQYSVGKDERAAQALPGYENFVYQRLVPACFQVPADQKFNVKTGQPVSERFSVTGVLFSRLVDFHFLSYSCFCFSISVSAPLSFSFSWILQSV